MCFTEMLQTFVRNVSSILVLEIFYLDVAYVFTQMLHAFVPNISSVSNEYWGKFFWCCKCFHVSSVEWDGQSHTVHIRRRGCERDMEQAQAHAVPTCAIRSRASVSSIIELDASNAFLFLY